MFLSSCRAGFVLIVGEVGFRAGGSGSPGGLSAGRPRVGQSASFWARVFRRGEGHGSKHGEQDVAAATGEGIESLAFGVCPQRGSGRGRRVKRGRLPHRPLDPTHLLHQRLVPVRNTARSDDPSPFTKFVPEPHSGESHGPGSRALLAHLLFRDDRVELAGLRRARSDTAARRWCAPRLRLSGAASQDRGGRRRGRSWVGVGAIDRRYRS